MIQLDDKTLRKLRAVQIEMLVEVDRICRKCGIHYNIFCGTLLGAVRHGGYIPWDDDADVAFLRPEYEKFRKACEKELDTTRFYFQDQSNTPGYRWGYGKIRRKGTLFLREHQEHMPYAQGVFIDIAPLDSVPDHYVARLWQNFHCFCIRKVLWSEVGKVAEKNPVRRWIYKLLSQIPEKTLRRYFQSYVDRTNRQRTKLVRELMFPKPNAQYGFCRQWFEESREYLFEGCKLRGVKEYDAYLKATYNGDYMTLPPESERKVHPVSAIELPELETFCVRSR